MKNTAINSSMTASAGDGSSVNTRMLCLTGLFTAIICIATMVIQIPIPLGYAHLGDCMILLASVCLGKKMGMFAGGVGSALADCLTGFVYWAPATLIIKAAMGFMAAALIRDGEGKFKVFSVRTAVAAVLTLLFMVAGYVIAGAIIYGSIAAGISSAPGLLVKSIVNLVVFYAVAELLKRVHIVV